MIRFNKIYFQIKKCIAFYKDGECHLNLVLVFRNFGCYLHNGVKYLDPYLILHFKFKVIFTVYSLKFVGYVWRLQKITEVQIEEAYSWLTQMLLPFWSKDQIELSSIRPDTGSRLGIANIFDNFAKWMKKCGKMQIYLKK